MMKLKVIDDNQELRALSNVWNNLLSQSTAQFPFLRAEYVEAAVENGKMGLYTLSLQKKVWVSRTHWLALLRFLFQKREQNPNCC